MVGNSRKGKRIARRACDMCRDRRVQCAIADEQSESCQRCLQAGVPCTFLKDRRQRGPPSKYVLSARQNSAIVTNSPGLTSAPPGLPLGGVTVAHFLPETTLNSILDDFLLHVYPVLPVVHVPSFKDKLERRVFLTDDSFLRLCLTLCAVTVASIPRSVTASDGPRHGAGWYTNAAEMVDRASHLVLISRISTDPSWQSKASVDSMVVSVVLAMASHYAGKANAGWAYASEAIHFFRELELYKASAYENMPAFDAEICKRSFWLLFIIQVHDRLSFTIPHTGLSYDPQHTDWEFLMPLEINDEDITSGVTPPADLGSMRPTPVISGFVALIKVFLCIVDLLERSFPGPPSYFSMSSGNLAAGLLGINEDYETPAQPPSEVPQLESLLRIMTRLDHILSNLPAPLRLPQRSQDEHRPVDDHEPAPPPEFLIMRANIHITAIYFQSLILEICLERFTQNDTSPPSAVALVRDSTTSKQLWQMKESVARELLDIVACSSPAIIESNGSSMIRKIREIGATFLGNTGGYGTEEDGSVEERRSSYLKKFVEILADLDYIQQ